MLTTSYWIESAALPRFPRPTKNISVDVVVVGGGIMGITAAYLCKKQGLTVALIERNRCARIDSGHTTAHLTAVTDERLQHIVKIFGEDAAKAVWEGGAAAIDQITNLIRDREIACDFKWLPGYLHAPLSGAAEATTLAELQKEAETAQRFGIRAEYLSEIPGFDVPGVRFAHQAIFHPRKYLAGLLRGLAGEGSHVFEQTTAEEFKARPRSVKAGGYTIRGGYVIIATHNPLMGNTSTGPALLLQTKLSLYTSYALGARLPAASLPEASYWDTGDPYYYLRVERRRGFDYAVFGGEDHKTGQSDDTEACYQRLEKKLLSFAPKAKIDHRWSGQVINTNDGLPLMGETASRQFVGTGFAGNGLTFGTLAAMMATDAALGRKNPWEDLFDVHRKKVRGGLWRYLKENKDYPYYMVRDRLAGSEGESLGVLKRGEGMILNLKGEKVAAHRDAAGAITLCSPVCTHMGGIVGWNQAEQTWDCPCHGARFKPNGDVLAGPAEDPLEKIPLEKSAARKR